jgi:CDP-diacylglycerol---glycerol-3-phosphate 3-phosphatidyltransferase
MANRITLLRIATLFLGVRFIYSDTARGELIAFGIILIVMLLDGLDGIIARREGRADATGAVMDILGDRVVEATLWVVFAHIGLIPVWVPITVIVRGLATDAVRSIGLARGETAFGERGVMRSALGRFLVASRGSRVLYASAKVVTFGYLILYLALIKLQAAGAPLGEFESRLPWVDRIGLALVYFSVALCVLRGVPVLMEGRRYARDS